MPEFETMVEHHMYSKIIIFGVGPFSHMICALLKSAGTTAIVRTAHKQFIPTTSAEDLPFFPFETITETHPPHEYHIIVALEHARWNVARTEIAEKAKTQGYRLASYIHPSAKLGNNVTLGEHILILEDVTAQYDVHIGANSIIGAKCFFGQGVKVAPNSYFGSGVFVDRFAQIGNNSTLSSQVRIAESVLIPSWTQIKAFESVKKSLTYPTIILDELRAPGFIIDRR